MTPHKRYFAYTVKLGFIKWSGYFDRLAEAKRTARLHAGIWAGWWAVSDTRLAAQGKMTVASGMGKPSKPKEVEPVASKSRPILSPYRPQAVRWHQ